MLFERWSEAPRRLPLLFLAVMLIPVLALGWLTVQLLERDRRLETQHAQERAERAADRIVAASHQRLSELESGLRRIVTGDVAAAPAGTVLAVAEGDRIIVTPAGALVYYPILPKASHTPSDVFAEGERYEYRLRDLGKAINWFQARARTEDRSLRAGALLRLGRNQNKVGQSDAALATYAELAALGAITVDGFPAAVLALEARCEILDKAGRRAELAAAASALRTGLSTGVWPLLRDGYEFYAEEARRWTGESAETEADRNARGIAAAFQSAYERWANADEVPQRRWLIAEGRPVLLTTAVTPKRMVALMAGAPFLQDAWKDVTGVHVLLTDDDGHAIAGEVPDGSAPQAVRPTDASKLPWTLRVASATLDADRSETAQRRRLLLAGLAMVLVLLGGSAYFTLRGVSRELAVARLQSDFVAAVSHEFRTPLASVHHLSDMLSQGRVGDEGQRQQCYDFLLRESTRLERLVEDVLDFGRIEGGAYQYRFEPVDAAVLLRALVQEFQEAIRPKGYRVELSIDAESATVIADPAALSRAIRNLLDNAVKYSPGADTIWVTLALEHNSVVIRVRDRGLGIALDEQTQIFRKFVRGRNARSQQIQGTGIGLAMVRHVVEAHHGEVRLESRPNQGSTFALLLPMSGGEVSASR